MSFKSSSKLVNNFRGINLACGGKLCEEPGWINADPNPSRGNVMKIDLRKPLLFKENTFDVVYHSQFIEHLPHDKAINFMRECHRILKPGGVLRVVTPDLYNQATEYLRNLQAVLDSPDDQVKLRYDWIRLEMLDQLTRHAPGGEMIKFLEKSGHNIRDYLWERMGRSGNNLVPSSVSISDKKTTKVILRLIKTKIFKTINHFTPKQLFVGRFRLSGESHLCMYDEYLLSNLFRITGFSDVSRENAKSSRIESWDATKLDCDSQGNPDGSVSLFMEAIKPIIM